MSDLLDVSCETHTFGVFDSVDELLAMCVPFCDAGVRAGQPVVVALSPAHADAVRAELSEPARVHFVSHGEQYQHPPGALRALEDIARCHGADASSRVRILGEPPPLQGLAQDGWLRYEAVTNAVLADFALDRLCVYHRQALSAAAEAELRRTHPLVLGSDGTAQLSVGYRDPATFTATRQRVVTDPLEERRPAVELCDPTVAAARQAVEAVARDAGVAPATTDDLVLAVNELLTNAVRHGEPPAVLRGWSAPGRSVIAVHDGGIGPRDPAAGLQPDVESGGDHGLGLWIAHQLCPEIAMSRSPDGFTVRLAAGDAAMNPSARLTAR